MAQRFREALTVPRIAERRPLGPDYLYQDVVCAQTCFPLRVWSLVHAGQRMPGTSRTQALVLGLWRIPDGQQHVIHAIVVRAGITGVPCDSRVGRTQKAMPGSSRLCRTHLFPRSKENSVPSPACPPVNLQPRSGLGTLKHILFLLFKKPLILIMPGDVLVYPYLRFDLDVTRGQCQMLSLPQGASAGVCRPPYLSHPWDSACMPA